VGCVAQILRYEGLDGCLGVYVRTHDALEKSMVGYVPRCLCQ
jgi:hypothetical protein